MMPARTSLEAAVPVAERRSDGLTPLLFGWFAALTVALYTGALLVFVYRHTSFIGDDLDILLMARSLSFTEFVLRPQDEHIVPMHRIVSYLVDALAPRRFGVALLVLYVFQLLNLVSSYRILRLLERRGSVDDGVRPGEPRGALGLLLTRPTSWVLFVLYATYLHVGSLFLWWTSGLHRLPFLALTATAIYYYLDYRWTGRRLAVVVCAVCTLASFGFYTKAFFVPFYLIAIELCLGRGASELSRYKRVAFLLTLLLASCCYVIVWQRLQPAVRQDVNSDALFQLRFVGLTWVVLRDSTLGSVYALGKLTPAAVLGSLAWLGAFAYTMLKRPSNWRVWGALIALVTMNALATGSSKARSGLYGLAMPLLTFRYYYELFILVVVFTAIAFARSRSGAPSGAALVIASAASWVTRTLARPFQRLSNREHAGAWVARGACLVALGAIAVNSYASSTRLITGYYANHQRARNFMWRLEHDSWRIIAKEKRALRIVEGVVPREIHGLVDMLHSDLLFAWDIPHDVVPPTRRGAHRITEFGHVVPVAPEQLPQASVR